MAFRNYLEGEDDAPYYKLNSLAHYYEEMQRYAALIKEMTGYIKDYGNELGLTKDEIDQRVTAYILQNKAQLEQRLGEWDEKLQQFDGSVTDLLAEWVEDGTLNHIIDTTLIDQKIAPLATQSAENRRKLSYSEIQAARLSGFFYKLMTKQDVLVIAEGDSLTYGHDTVSTDKRIAPTTKTDNGVNHGFTRGSTTYPEQLQTNLRTIFGNTSIVINKGYSGDYADLSYQHWTKNDNADIALLMLGTNDASNGAHIPADIQKNVEAYVGNMRRLIERFLDWNTPVILLTPPRTQQTESATTTGQYIKAFREALFYLGAEYGCPVIDMEEFCNGLDSTYYSDNLHFNGKGYSYLANRLTSVFIGFLNKPSIYPDGVIGIRATRDNYVLNSVTLSNALNSSGPEEGSSKGNSLLMNINAGSSAHISFYAETDDLILIPIHGIVGGATAKYTLDNGSDQGSSPLTQSALRTYADRLYPPATVTSSIATNVKQAFDGTVNVNTVNDYIHITNKGLHSLRIENGTQAGTVLLQGFLVRSYKDFFQGNTTEDNAFVPVISATTLPGSPVYNKRLSRITKIGSIIYHSLVLNVTMDHTVDGSIFILLKNRPENIVDLKIHVPINESNGIFTDNTRVTGVLNANNPNLYLQKTNNGITSNVTGMDVRGKTLDLFVTAIFKGS